MRLVCGVGINDLRWSHDRRYHSEYEAKVYQLWNDMLCRCYSSRFHKHRPSYKGCTVCERWKTLSSFAEDIKTLPNYDKWLQGGYQLDKDIRLGYCMVYDVEHCMFVTLEDNNREMVIRTKTRSILVEMADGRELEFSNAEDCSRYFGVCRTTVSSSWLGRGSNPNSKYGIKSIRYK